MFIVGILGWWYGRGWGMRAQMLRDKLMSTFDYFSIDLLLRTLFSPYRQISAGKVRGALGVQMRAFADRLISRMIGGMIRLTMILIGSVILVVYAIFGVILLVVWGVVPLLPLISIVMVSAGWTP
ncbi:MAG TPA: hypothetical protein VLG36_01815 [Candidatus Chromulinivoraceae bacterium]|nr:hypothetical protein [Candidatus Chromulinivoraceae bacterium]